MSDDEANEEAQRWIPVSERLPEAHPNYVLVAFPAGRVDMWSADYLVDDMRYSLPDQPSHWQPLPPAPEGEG